MPIYEYQCNDCQAIFEEWQSGFEDRDVPCPECGKESKRLISNTAFHLKGSGWYATEYGGKTPSGGNEDGEGSGGEQAAKPDSGDESTPSVTPSSDSADTSSAESVS